MRLTALLCSLALVGCGSPTAVVNPDPVPEDLDPAALTLPDSIIYACGDWSPAAPRGEFGLFDVIWSPMTPERRVAEGPTVEQVRAVEDVGGRVVHEFHIPMVRAILRPETAPVLGANMVRGVPDAGAHPVRVFIHYGGWVTDADEQMIENLGGTVTAHLTHIHSLGAIVPDSAISVLRTQGSVLHVSGVGEGTGCLEVGVPYGTRSLLFTIARD